MKYRQLSLEERCTLTALRREGLGIVAISERLGRHQSTLWRELGRNRSRHDGGYRVHQAQERTRARRSRSRRNQRFGKAELAQVEALLREEWSPEQIAGTHVDLRTDVYVLGVMLFELFTLRPPFGGDRRELEYAHMSFRSPRPSRFVPLPEQLEEVVLRCLSKDPTARFADAEVLRAAALGPR